MSSTHFRKEVQQHDQNLLCVYSRLTLWFAYLYIHVAKQILRGEEYATNRHRLGRSSLRARRARRDPSKVYTIQFFIPALAGHGAEEWRRLIFLNIGYLGLVQALSKGLWNNRQSGTGGKRLTSTSPSWREREFPRVSAIRAAQATSATTDSTCAVCLQCNFYYSRSFLEVLRSSSTATNAARRERPHDSASFYTRNSRTGALSLQPRASPRRFESRSPCILETELGSSC